MIRSARNPIRWATSRYASTTSRTSRGGTVCKSKTSVIGIRTGSPSGSDITSVETAGNADVVGALDDGAAVGEDGHLVRGAEEAQRVFIRANITQRAQSLFESSQVDRVLAMVDLDRIAATEADG